MFSHHISLLFSFNTLFPHPHINQYARKGTTSWWAVGQGDKLTVEMTEVIQGYMPLLPKKPAWRVS